MTMLDGAIAVSLPTTSLHDASTRERRHDPTPSPLHDPIPARMCSRMAALPRGRPAARSTSLPTQIPSPPPPCLTTRTVTDLDGHERHVGGGVWLPVHAQVRSLRCLHEIAGQYHHAGN